MKTELKKKSSSRISFIIDTSSTISLLKNVRPNIMIESLLDWYCNFFHFLLSLCLSFLYPRTFRAPKKAKWNSYINSTSRVRLSTLYFHPNNYQINSYSKYWTINIVYIVNISYKQTWVFLESEFFLFFTHTLTKLQRKLSEIVKTK